MAAAFAVQPDLSLAAGAFDCVCDEQCYDNAGNCHTQNDVETESVHGVVRRFYAEWLLASIPIKSVMGHSLLRGLGTLAEVHFTSHNFAN
jgi:hypothetical protein